MDIILPREPRQKFQVGDICKIVKKGYYHEQMEYPNRPLESFLSNRDCIVLHTYAQVYWGMNFTDYSVYLLPREDGEYTGSFAWIEENQLKYLRPPVESEIKILVDQDNQMLKFGGPYTSIFFF